MPVPIKDMEESSENHSDNNNQQVRPPLLTSCLIGDEEAVLNYIKAGVDVNQTDFSGCTPLQLASAAGHINIVKTLLRHGAKPEKQDSTHGNTCLHEAAWRGYSRLVKILSNKDTVNVQNHGGFTPLHLSCQAGHNQSTRELLLASADPNLVNTYGDTALHTAVRYGHAGVARILLSARTPGDVQNKNGDTPLHIASAMGRKKLTTILLSSGCKLGLRNHQRETPLDISLRKDYEEVSGILQDPPEVITPMERDEIRGSKMDKAMVGPGAFSKRKKDWAGSGRDLRPSSSSPRRSKGSGSHGGRKSKSSKRSSSKDSPSNSNSTDPIPNWSPYGCHFYPNPSAFPSPNIDSLPKEPLRSGELYYLDLAGNIHKGPIGISEGCYCTPILAPALSAIDSGGDHCAKNCHNQLKSLTAQLSKIHLDTQAQLESLQSMLNEKLRHSKKNGENEDEEERDWKSTNHLSDNEFLLRDWVKKYRRFRKELVKNPKALMHANELLEQASTLMIEKPSSSPESKKRTGEDGRTNSKEPHDVGD